MNWHTVVWLDKVRAFYKTTLFSGKNGAEKYIVCVIVEVFFFFFVLCLK